MNDDKLVQQKRFLARGIIIVLALFAIITVGVTNTAVFIHSGLLRRAGALVSEALMPTTPPSVKMNVSSEIPPATTPPLPIPEHIATPSPLHAVYVSSYGAGSVAVMSRIYHLINTVPVNAVVIDIKDATGRLSYEPRDSELIKTGVGTRRIKNLSSLISTLHQKGIYVIGRVAVFQDPYYATLHPEDAFKRLDTGELWKDYKGIMWLRPNSVAVWEYAARIARDAHMQGFDEINVDYVRFPSDGELAMLDKTSFVQSKSVTMKGFFQYLDTELRQKDHITLSADLFGLTLSARDDLGIGQTLAIAAPYVDYVAPMIYPSHFRAGTYGIALPAASPGAIITRSLSDGIAKLAVFGIPKDKLRPWLQDFNLGATYTADMVRAQMDASAALGITSWMVWNPANRYSTPAFLPAAVSQTLAAPMQ